MEAAAKRQDLPPPGGYESISYKRAPAKTYFKGRTMFIGYALMMAGSAYVYLKTAANVRRKEQEYLSATYALMPLYLAENQRIQLKQLRRNRDAERELMKDVPGWEVGTYYGEKIFKANKMLVPFQAGHLYVHASYDDYYKPYSVKDLLV